VTRATTATERASATAANTEPVPPGIGSRFRRNGTHSRFVLGLLAVPAAAEAHSFVQPYTLPVPFGLYLYGAAATLLLTFFVLAYFARPATMAIAPAALARRSPSAQVPAWLVDALRAFAVGVLLLTLIAGFYGTRNPDANIGMTLFWVIFVLGMTYATVLIGDVFAIINPWRTIADWLRLSDAGRGRVAYPQWLGYWPALVAYVALIWIELFALPKPSTLAIALLVYSGVTFAGVWLFGADAWFRRGELFSVLLRLVGLLAPLEYRMAPNGVVNVRTRPLFAGVLEGNERAGLHQATVSAGARSADGRSISVLLFVLFMLSSTTFDGMHETLVWMNLFWKYLLHAFQPLWGTDLIASQRMLEHWYVAFQRAGLVLSPFIYLAVYMIVIACMKAMTRTTMTVRELALAFAFTVLPIAIVYNMAHYWTLLLLQLPKLPYLVADPFGAGWTLPGLGPPPAEPPPLDMAPIWNTEVMLIVGGHLVGVYLAHRVALRVFDSRRAALVSQLPMLVLMVVYTVLGLWVISQPLALER